MKSYIKLVIYAKSKWANERIKKILMKNENLKWMK